MNCQQHYHPHPHHHYPTSSATSPVNPTLSHQSIYSSIEPHDDVNLNNEQTKHLHSLPTFLPQPLPVYLMDLLLQIVFPNHSNDMFVHVHFQTFAVDRRT